MTDFRNTPELDDQEVLRRLNSFLAEARTSFNPRSAYTSIMGMIDLTTLEGADTDEKVRAMCAKAVSFKALGLGFPNVAAVCVYPTLVRVARRALENSSVEVASVAGAFPSGLSPLSLRVAEVKYAVEEGADEIDMVISRGKFLEGEYSFVFDEIAAIREACGNARLKVILETGELNTATNIRRASDIALEAGAHFIKTSTGKIQPAATLKAMMVMLESIKNHFENTGNMAGIKAAGGISEAETAVDYYLLTKQMLGNDWMDKQLFRIGASRLTDALVESIRKL